MRVPLYFRTLLQVHCLEVKGSKLKKETEKYCNIISTLSVISFGPTKYVEAVNYSIYVIILHLWLSIKTFCYSMTTYVPLNALLNESINRGTH